MPTHILSRLLTGRKIATHIHTALLPVLSPLLLHHRPPYQHCFHSLELARSPLRSDACVTVYVKLFLISPGKIHHSFPMLSESALDFYCYQRTYFLVWQWALLVCPVGSLTPGQQGLHWFISVCPMYSRAPAPEQEVNKWLLTDVESAANHQGFGCLDQWGEKELGAGKDLWLWSRNKRGTYWKLPKEGKLFLRGKIISQLTSWTQKNQACQWQKGARYLAQLPS